MFKKFWEENRGKIEIPGILCAIGALFLAIPIPNNEIAKDALQMIQFIWLVVISICLIFISIPFIKIASLIQKTKWGSLIFFVWLIIGASFLLIVNLWQYIISLYPKEIIEFLRNNGTGVVGLPVGLMIGLISKTKIHNNLKLIITVFLSIYWGFFCIKIYRNLFDKIYYPFKWHFFSVIIILTCSIIISIIIIKMLKLYHKISKKVS